MATKEELSDEINEVLGTQMEWDRMLQEELEHLHVLVHEGALAEPQAKQMAKKHGKEKVEREVDEWYPGKMVSKII